MRKISFAITMGVLALALTACSGGAKKNNDWAKNVEVLVPAKAGGGTDVMARALTGQVTKDSGSTLAVVNTTDGNGLVAMEKVRTGKADGSSILLYHTSMLLKTATGVYDKSASEDFTIIGVGENVDKGGTVLVVSSESQYKTLDDIINAAKERPGELLFGVETGGATHIQTGMIAKAADIDIKYVEAGSDTEKLTALIGGTLDACLVNCNQGKQYIESGKAIALAVISRDKEGTRGLVLPDVPTFVELGYDVSFGSFTLVVGPKDMDPELVTKIHDYFAAAAENSAVNEVLTPSGFELRFIGIEDGQKRVAEAQAEMNAMVEELGLKQK